MKNNSTSGLNSENLYTDELPHSYHINRLVVSLSIDAELLSEIDQAVSRNNFPSRSEFIRHLFHAWKKK